MHSMACTAALRTRCYLCSVLSISRYCQNGIRRSPEVARQSGRSSERDGPVLGQELLVVLTDVCMHSLLRSAGQRPVHAVIFKRRDAVFWAIVYVGYSVPTCRAYSYPVAQSIFRGRWLRAGLADMVGLARACAPSCMPTHQVGDQGATKPPLQLYLILRYPSRLITSTIPAYIPLIDLVRWATTDLNG